MITAEKGQSKWRSTKKRCISKRYWIEDWKQKWQRVISSFCCFQYRTQPSGVVLLGYARDQFNSDQIESIEEHLFVGSFFSDSTPFAVSSISFDAVMFAVCISPHDGSADNRQSQREEKRETQREGMRGWWAKSICMTTFVDIKMSTRWSRCASCAFL